MRKLVLILLLASIVYSCNNNNNSKKQPNEKVTLEQISNMENDLFGGDMTVPDIKKANELASLYVNYANQNPDDSLAPEYLFKAADISMNMNNPQNTVALFKHILNNYPNYKNMPTVMFLTGFVYDDQLKDYDSARKYYTEFLEKYPDSDFADDAQISLKNLGKTPEELIKEFENNSN